MEYAKDDIFVINFNQKEDKLSLVKQNKLVRIISQNKFLTLLITLGFVFGSINMFLIYSLIELLKVL